MRILFVAAIVCILFSIGLVIHTEIENRKFVKSLAQLPQVVEPLQVAASETDAYSEVELAASQRSDSQKQEVPADYDWRMDTDPIHQHGHLDMDPWSIVPDAEDTEYETMPVVWFQITDLYERAAAYRAQLIKQFGDQAAIDTLAELKPKIWQNIPLTLDEMIRHAEAQMDIWPTEGTRSSIELFKRWRAEGREVNFRHGSVPSAAAAPKEFRELSPFIKEYGREEGVRRFREMYPEKASVFRQYLLKEAPRQGVSLEAVEKLFPNADAPHWQGTVP